MSSAGVVVISPIRSEGSVVLSPLLSPLMDSRESVWIYLAMSGSVVPMRVLASDSIESVKLRIQTCKGFVVKNQKLVCGGRELARSNSLVKDYGVSDGNVLHLVLRLSDLQSIHVRTACGKEFTFHVERNRDVAYVKHQISKTKNGINDIEDQEVLCNGERLEDQKLINDICKHNDAVIHLFVRKSAKIRARPVEKNFELSIVAPKLNEVREYDVNREVGSGKVTDQSPFVPRKPPDREIILEPVIVNPKIELPLALKELINSAIDGLEAGSDPVRSSEGTGGAYFMLDSSQSKHLAVFKPTDEEPMAVNNPRDLPLSVDGEGLKKGTRVGEGALRECAAYILDHPKSGRRSFSGEDKGFSGVPLTCMVRCLHKKFNHPGGVNMKIGSLQLFTENNGSCEDWGPSDFPVEEVHKIAVLDVRLANADRHSGNILVNKGDDGKTALIPIDHGYCLPESFEDCTFDWLYWPQARKPFSPDTINYIKSLDAEEDIALLKFYGWDIPVKCARILRISTMLLKKGAERGLTPFVIGNMMCRKRLNEASMIEEIVQEAMDSVLPGSSEAGFLECVSAIMDRCLNEIV
ncbi:phosphatidylinositol 4-kinase gamma 4-like [Coffea eugenioides]|uniref:phosphatidylinositol 4-kinase gamma 4-like n=1 Tax=Coffea eugenioides TaxID=49369 RepID=UPI000F606B53|nr:phosphatidylinositol 4-kinase gamma 4-like [Coffea eugenioides]